MLPPIPGKNSPALSLRWSHFLGREKKKTLQWSIDITSIHHYVMYLPLLYHIRCSETSMHPGKSELPSCTIQFQDSELHNSEAWQPMMDDNPCSCVQGVGIFTPCFIVLCSECALLFLSQYTITSLLNPTEHITVSRCNWFYLSSHSNHNCVYVMFFSKVLEPHNTSKG